MNAALTQIGKSFDELGMTVEEICIDQGTNGVPMDEYTVKSALMMQSTKYRALCRTEPEEESNFNYSKEQMERAKQKIFDLAMSADDEHLQAKMSCRIIDENKGRLDIVKAVQGSTFNILNINQAIKSAREGAKQMRKAIAV